VVEVDGRPIAGALVELAHATFSRDPRFGQQAEPRRRTVLSTTRTNEAGAFDLELRLDEAADVQVGASASARHTRARHTLNVNEFVAGAHDLGDLVLRPAGWIRGRVRDPGGASVEGVYVVANALLNESSPVRVSESGEFAIERCRVGPCIVAAFGRSGARLADAVIQVEADVETVLELELREQPAAISGVVLDRWRRPAVGVVVRGEPAIRDRAARATTGADGAFVLYPRVSEPHALFLGEVSRPEAVLENVNPGDAQLVLVAEHGFALEIVALDAQSGAVLTDFGAARVPSLLMHLGGQLPQSAMPAADGRMLVFVDVRDDGIVCFADGYVPFAGPIAPDAGELSRQTVRLERGATLAGRLLAAPYARVSASPERQAVRGNLEALGYIDPDAATRVGQGLLQLFGNADKDVQGYFHPVVRAIADEHGAFELEGLSEGTYTLDAHAAVGRCSVRGVPVPRAGTLDLGDLELIRYARLEGVIRSARVAATSLHVRRSSLTASAVTADAEGNFAIDRIEPGRHEFHLGDHRRPGQQLGKHTLELAPGETRRVEWTVDGP
jgi:hypothetical protein